MKIRLHGEFLFCLVLLVVSLIGTGYARAEEPKKILCIEAFDMLNTLPDTYLIDVRSREEYQLVGHPLQAYNFPYMFFTTQFVKEGERQGYEFQKNKAFLDQINKAFKTTDNLLILGRDGVRSALAAKELSNAGFKNVYDVYDGFEGREFPYFEDPNRQKFYRQLAKRYKISTFEHRRHYGWQWWGLPWTYDMDPKYVYPPDLGPAGK
jgi:rhodanese-related sulfurtransferase